MMSYVSDVDIQRIFYLNTLKKCWLLDENEI